MAQHLALPDGRNLDYLISGDPNGFPFLYIHGTPGSYKNMKSLEELAGRKHLKMISLSRAGYGGSTRWKGRSVADTMSDADALLKHLNVEKYLVAGWSGGGPHALACAARLTGCLAALIIAGVGPYGVEGLDFLAGQGEDNILEFSAALEGEPELQKFCSDQRGGMISSNPKSIVEALASILPDVDKRALERAEMGKDLVATMQEALKEGVDGWVDDDMAFISPWGFKLSEIKVPVLLYQGSLDLMVPYAHGQWLAKHLPQDSLRKHLLEGQGHISIFVDCIEAMMDELLEVSIL